MLTRFDISTAINGVLAPLRDFFTNNQNRVLAWVFNLPVIRQICTLVYLVMATIAIMLVSLKLAVEILNGVLIAWGAMLGKAEVSSVQAGIEGAKNGTFGHYFDCINYVFPLTELCVFLFAYMSWCIALFSLKSLLAFYRLIPGKAT